MRLTDFRYLLLFLWLYFIIINLKNSFRLKRLFCMKNSIKIALIFVLLVFSCSTKKNNIVSRNWHSLNTKYNVLFNGQEILKKGIEELNEKYKDDWFERLPIEPIEFEEDKTIIEPPFGLGYGFDESPKEEEKEKESSTPFSKAEEKAVKSIQKHGMNIEGIERNNKIDDSYLLLGKARYYEQRFIPALEAFNYIIGKYPSASLINETKIWRAKTNIRIDNEELAIESLKLLLHVIIGFEEELSDEIRELAHTTLAMGYEKMDSLQKMKKHLIKSTETLKNKSQGARNIFILGQIYSAENKKDSAIIAFNRILNFKKAPYKYKIHANIEIAKNTNSVSESVFNKMTELIKNIENKPYLDKLYYQLGFLYEKKDSIKLAIDYYNKSLKSNSGVTKQKSFTYERLGNINFKEAKYKLAGSYYDSVIRVSKDSMDLRIRRVKRKSKNLETLIRLENTVSKNDSILKIALLSDEDQKIYFQNYIEKLKKKEEEAQQLALNKQAFESDLKGNIIAAKKKSGEWYFYNSQTLKFGINRFKQIWGNRELQDDWRWSSRRSSNNLEISTSDAATVEDSKYSIDSYLKKVPKDKEVLDSLKTTMNRALYELGLVYKEQFRNNKMCIEKLERVASLNPEEELILPINWHLYKVYKEIGDEAKYNKHKNIILTNYPNTSFAKIIKSPNKKIEEVESVSEVKKLYKELYNLYKKNKFKEVVSKISKVLPTINNSTLVPKFDILKAYSIGKYQDKVSFISALNYVAVNYEGTEESKNAKKTLKKLKSNIKKH